MKKKILTLITVILLTLCLLSPVFADEEDLPLLIDDADILTDDAEADIYYDLLAVSDRYNCDVVLLTIASLSDFGYTDGQACADDFYDFGGYGRTEDYDGMLFLWVNSERTAYISTHGYCIYAVTDTGIDYIFDQMTDGLSESDYYTAFTEYADSVDYLLERAVNGNRLTSEDKEDEELNPLLKIPAALIIGLLPAGIIVNVWKAQLKSVSMQRTANNYTKEGSVNIINGGETFLYSNVSKQKKQKQESTTHTSSSGRTHGGGSRKF